MNKDQLLKRLAALIEEIERGRQWGTIEIQFGDGMANLIRKSTTEKLGNAQERTRAADARNRY